MRRTSRFVGSGLALVALFTAPLEALEIGDFIDREVRERGLEGVWASLSAQR